MSFDQLHNGLIKYGFIVICVYMLFTQPYLGAIIVIVAGFAVHGVFKEMKAKIEYLQSQLDERK